MNNKQLQYAIALSKSLNFSQVAEQLRISQPALSKQISHLEKELGVLLFDRKQNPITLTAAGETFFKEAQTLLYREEQLYRSMEEFKSGKMGRLTIGVSPFRALYLLPELCRRVREKFPGVSIVLQEESSDQLRKKAAEGKYDFAIANLPVDESVVDAIPIEQDRLVLVVPNTLLPLLENTPETKSEEIDFKDCKRLPFVVVGQNQEMRQLFEKICSDADITPLISMEAVSLATTWAMTKSGVGAALLPMQFVQSMQSSDDVSLFIPKYTANIRQPAILTRRGQYLSEYAKYAIGLLTKR